MLPITRNISKYNHYDSNVVNYIVIHDVGTASTAANNGVYFAGGNRNASAHYFVDDNQIIQSVEDYHGAWHVGDGNGKYGVHNQNSIGIEMCLPTGVVTEKTVQNTLELTKYLMKKYGVPIGNVVRHYDASRKNCPRQFNLDGKWTRWWDFKARLDGQAVTPTPTPAPSGGFKVEAWNKRQSVDVAVLNVRAAQTADSGKVGLLRRGDTFNATRICRNGQNVNGYTTWFEVDGRGWVSGAYVTEVKATTPAPSKPQGGSYTFRNTTNVRDRASLSGSVVAQYQPGQTVNYDSTFQADGYTWMSWIGGSGKRRYAAMTN